MFLCGGLKCMESECNMKESNLVGDEPYVLRKFKGVHDHS
jgi:hypothetical protein